MAQIIETAKVRILPDFDGFGEELHEKLHAAVTEASRGLKAKVEVEVAGLDSVKTHLNGLKSTAITAKVKVDLDAAAANTALTQIKQKLDAIKDKTVTVRVNYVENGTAPNIPSGGTVGGPAGSGGGATPPAGSGGGSTGSGRAFGGRIRSEAEQIQKAHIEAMREDARRSQAGEREAAKIRKEREKDEGEQEKQKRRESRGWFQRLLAIDDEDKSSSTGVKKGALARFFGSSQALTYGVGLGAVTSAPAVGSTLALGAGFTAATAAAVTFGAVATAQIADVTTAVKNFEAGESLTGQLAPFAGIIASVEKFKTTWYGLLEATREPVFALFEKALDTVGGLLPRLVPIVDGVSGAISGMFDAVNSPDAERFLDVLGVTAVSAIESLSQTATNFGLGVANIFSGFAGASQPFLDGLQSISAKFLAWTQSLAGSNGFSNFIEYIKVNGPKFLDIAQNLAVAIGKIVVALAPVGATVLDALKGFSAFLASLSPQTWLALITVVATFVAVLKTMSIFSAVTTWAKELTVAIRLTGAAFGQTVSQATAARMALIGFGASLVAGLAIAALVTSLVDLSGAQTDAGEAARSHADSLDQLTQSALANNGAITQDLFNRRALDLQKLGIFDVKGVDAKRAAAGYSGQDDAGFAETKGILKSRADQLQKQHDDARRKLGGADLPFVSDNVLQKTVPFGPDLVKMQAQATAAQHLYDVYKSGGSTSKELADALDQAKKAGVDVTKVFNDQANALGPVITAFQRYQSVIAETPEQQVLSDVISKYDAYTNAQHALTKAQQAQGDTTARTARADRDASRAVTDAERALADAHRSTEKAQRDLTAARREAIENLKELHRQVRDLDVNEEELKIKLVQANLSEQQTRGLDADSLTRREAVIKAIEAQRALEDFYADKPELLRKAAEADKLGVEGSPNVKAAKQGLDDAQYAEGRAAEKLTDAQDDNTRTLTESKRANDDATYAVTQATNALNEQKAAWDVASAYAHVTADQVEGVRSRMNALEEDKAVELQIEHKPGSIDSVNAAIDSVTEKLGVLKLMAADPTISYEDALKQYRLGAQPTETLPQAQNRKVQNTLDRLGVTDRAVGGPVIGPGTGTSDSILATGPGSMYALSHGEHVVTSDEVNKVGGHAGMFALRKAIRGLATGGPVETVLDIGKLNLGDQIARSGLLNRFVDTLFAGPAGGAFTGPSGAGFSINEIIAAARQSGLEANPTNTLRRGDPGFHGRGQAVDFGSGLGGAGSPANDALGAWWFNSGFAGRLRELIHTSVDGSHGWYIKDGHPVPKGWYGAATEAAHINHVHVAAAPGFSEGITAAAATTSEVFGSLAEFLAYRPDRGAAAPGGSGVERWRGTVQKALADSGFPTSDDYVGAVLRQIGTESGGNEKVIQSVHDVNWPNNLARGLMQVTPGTFGAYQAPGHADIFSGYDNLLAALRYVRGRYHGDVLGVLGHGHGYDEGGHIKPGEIGWSNARKPERILSPDQTEAFDRLVGHITGGSGGMRLDEYTIARLAQALSTRPIPVHVDGRQVADAVIPHLERRL